MQVSDLFEKASSLLLLSFLLSFSLMYHPYHLFLPPGVLFPCPPPLAKAWLLSKWKKTFYNIKGRLFRKGRPCWGVEEACLLTLDTSYLRQLQMYLPLVIPTPCQVGLSRVTTLTWVGDHQGITSSFRDNFQLLLICFVLFNFLPRSLCSSRLRGFAQW